VEVEEFHGVDSKGRRDRVRLAAERVVVTNGLGVLGGSGVWVKKRFRGLTLQPLGGRRSSPSSDASKYPSKSVLLKALEDAHAGVAAALAGVPESRWTESTPIEEVRGFLPTLGDCFVFVMAAHENMHLGQLSAWRRVQGMGRV
jgi:hypothetical protein